MPKKVPVLVTVLLPADVQVQGVPTTAAASVDTTFLVGAGTPVRGVTV